LGGVDVVFDQHRDAMQQTTRPLGFAFLIKRVGNRQRTRI
jgi:hypothetical protein